MTPPIKFAFVLIGLALVTCGGTSSGPAPVPSPTPLPSPTPSPSLPLLTISGNQFIAAGQPLTLLGGIICCGDGVKERGWPLINSGALRELAAFGANYTHLRTGPHKAELEGEEFVAFNSDGSFRQSYFDRIAAIVSEAEGLGIYVEVDLVDGWGPKHDLAAWPDGARCEIFEESPDPLREAWIRKLVQTVGASTNVLWQDGNEIGVLPCGRHLSVEWVLGLVAIVRNEERLNGFPTHLISTNSHSLEIEALPAIDYINRHQDVGVEPTNKPIGVNEAAGLSPEEWQKEAEWSCLRGTYFMQWRMSWTEAETQRALGYLKELRSGSCK